MCVGVRGCVFRFRLCFCLEGIESSFVCTVHYHEGSFLVEVSIADGPVCCAFGVIN